MAKTDIGLNLQRLCNDTVQHCNLAPQYCRDVAAMLWCCVGRGESCSRYRSAYSIADIGPLSLIDDEAFRSIIAMIPQTEILDAETV